MDQNNSPAVNAENTNDGEYRFNLHPERQRITSLLLNTDWWFSSEESFTSSSMFAPPLTSGDRVEFIDKSDVARLGKVIGISSGPLNMIRETPLMFVTDDNDPPIFFTPGQVAKWRHTTYQFPKTRLVSQTLPNLNIGPVMSAFLALLGVADLQPQVRRSIKGQSVKCYEDADGSLRWTTSICYRPLGMVRKSNGPGKVKMAESTNNPWVLEIAIDGHIWDCTPTNLFERVVFLSNYFEGLDKDSLEKF